MPEWLINFFTAGFESALGKILTKQEENFTMLAAEIEAIKQLQVDTINKYNELVQTINTEREQYRDKVDNVIASQNQTIASQQEAIAQLMEQMSSGDVGLQEAKSQAQTIFNSLTDAVNLVSTIVPDEPVVIEPIPVEPTPEDPTA